MRIKEDKLFPENLTQHLLAGGGRHDGRGKYINNHNQYTELQTYNLFLNFLGFYLGFDIVKPAGVTHRNVSLSPSMIGLSTFKFQF